MSPGGARTGSAASRRANRRLDYRWRLREVMATRGMFSTTDLRPLLAQRGIELSASQVWRLVVEKPDRLSLSTLMALIDALECQISDLIEPITTTRTTTGTAAVAATGAAGATGRRAGRSRRATSPGPPAEPDTATTQDGTTQDGEPGIGDFRPRPARVVQEPEA